MLDEYIKLLRAIGKGWTFLFLLILRAPFDIASTIINAMFLQYAFDAVNQGDAAWLAYVCMMFGFASLCLFLYNGVVWSIYAPFAARMEGMLRMKLYNKILSFSYMRVEATTRGEWLTRLNADVEMPFSRAVHLPHAACAIFNIIVSAIILWLINPAVFGWVIAFTAPHIAVSQLLVARAMPGLSKKSLEATAVNTEALAAFITCSDIAALYDGHGYLMKKFELSSKELLKANMRIRARNALNAGIGGPLFGLGGYLTLLLVCSGWIADGHITFGGLTAAFTYRGGVLAGALMLVNCIASIQSSMAGIRRMNDVLSEAEEGQSEL